MLGTLGAALETEAWRWLASAVRVACTMAWQCEGLLIKESMRRGVGKVRPDAAPPSSTAKTIVLVY